MNPSSKWRLAAFDDDLSTDNALLSEEQESAKHNIFITLERIQDAAAEPLDVHALAAIVESITDKDPNEAIAIAQEYLQNPVHNELETEPVEPQIENQVSQDQMMGQGMQSLDSTVPGSAPPPGQAFSRVANDGLLAEIKRFVAWKARELREASVIDAEDGFPWNDKRWEEKINDSLIQEVFSLVENSKENANDEYVDSMQDLERICPGASRVLNYAISNIQELSSEEIQQMAGDDPEGFIDRFAKYPGHHKEHKPGDKKHLKGEGPVNEKANEIYHAIMREKGDGEPSKDDQSSAAAIAWSQAQKSMKKKKEKKAFFRGEEAEVLDSYRDMWGQNLVRIRVEGKVIDVAEEEISRQHKVADLNKIETLVDFVENMPNKISSGASMLARIENLKIAMNEARVLLLDSDLSFNEQKALNSVYTRCAAELEELDQFDNFVTEEDLERVEELPKFEIGKEIHASSFSQHISDWDSVIESIEPIEDIDKFVREDPIILVSELPESLMSDAGAVRTHAKKRVASATAYVDESIRSEVVSKYLSNVEDARRSAFYISKMANKTRVESGKKEFDSTPDEGMFL